MKKKIAPIVINKGAIKFRAAASARGMSVSPQNHAKIAYGDSGWLLADA